MSLSLPELSLTWVARKGGRGQGATCVNFVNLIQKACVGAEGKPEVISLPSQVFKYVAKFCCLVGVCLL